MIMTRQRTGNIIALLVVASFFPVPAQAQLNKNKAVQRYNRVAKGANVGEWRRRLSDPNVKVRLDAVDSLGKAGTEKSVRPLLDATVDTDRRVRVKAIDYLGQIGSPMATPVLAQYLFLSDFDRIAKQRILVALGRIRDKTAVKPLRDFAAETSDQELLCTCLYTMGEIADPDSAAAVKAYLDSSKDPHVRRVAEDALAKINARLAAGPQVQPSLIELEKRLRPPPKKK